jgi:hypothetical protein
MDPFGRLSQQLGDLTLTLDDPGTDLKAILDVLCDDLTAAVPSFLGLTMTLNLDGGAVALTTVDSGPALVAGAWIEVALAMPRAEDAATLVCYARDPGSFVALAADTCLVGRSGHSVILEGELSTTPATAPGISGLDSVAAVNRAIGVLISRGDSPAQANEELRHRAAVGRHTLAEAAQQIVSTTNIR